MGKKGFTLSYDRENDILNISIGAAKKALSVESDDEVFLRVDPDNRELVGLTILGFKQSFLAKKQKVEVSPKLVVSSRV